MLEEPALDHADLVAEVHTAYGVDARELRFVPGHDNDAASYELRAADGGYFLKVRFGPMAQAPLQVPRALQDAGVPSVLAPLRTVTGDLSVTWLDRTLILYPFVAGPNAVRAGLTDDGWRTFGATLRAIHDSGLADRFRDTLPVETFSIAAADAVTRELGAGTRVRAAAARRLAKLFEEEAGRIGQMVARARELGARLASRPLQLVLCHADIHAANIIVTHDGIRLVDWDGPMLAPRERDLLFVIGSRIARRVEPREEALFFEGYGDVVVDPEAIVYYRYERILEDIAVDAASVFRDPTPSDAARGEMVDLIASFFERGGIVETAEAVDRVPGALSRGERIGQ